DGNAICIGATAHLCGPAGNFGYLWAPGGQTTQCIDVSPTTTTTYTLVVTDLTTQCASAGCPYTLTVNPPPPCTVTGPAGNAICLGATAHLCGPAGNFGYLWAPGGETTQCIDVSPTTTTTYTLVVTDLTTLCASAGCPYTLTVNPPPPCTVTGPAGNAICLGATAHLCGPAGNFGYLWAPGGETTQCIDVSPTTTTTYTLVVTDLTTQCASAGCPYTLTVHPPPPCTVTGPDGNAICLGATAHLCGPAGNFGYLWAPGGETMQCIDVSPTTTTTYTLVVTDLTTQCASAGCPYTLTVNPPPPCTVTGPAGNAICLGATAHLCGPAGNFGYLWAPGGETTQCIDVSPTTTTTYTLVVTDLTTQCASAGCPYTLTVHPPPPCTVTGPDGNAICLGATAHLCGPAGNFGYLWAPGGETMQCIDVSPTTTTTYTLVVTDLTTQCASAGCPYTLTVNPPPPCTVTGPAGNAICLGATAHLCGPAGNFGYLWAPGGETTQCIDVSPTTTTTYTLVVTDLTTLCASAGCPYTLTVNPPPPCTVTGPDGNAICLGATAHLCGPAGNFGYLWAPGGETTQCIDVSPTTTSTYTLVVTDLTTQCASAGCPYTLTVNPPPPCTVTGPDGNAICIGATAHLCGPAGNFGYLWAPGGQTTQCIDVSPTTTTTYTLVVTDLTTQCASAGCPYTLTVNPPPPCTVTGPTGNAICLGATAHLCGPAGNFGYLWAPGGQTTQCI